MLCLHIQFDLCVKKTHSVIWKFLTLSFETVWDDDIRTQYLCCRPLESGVSVLRSSVRENILHESRTNETVLAKFLT